MGLPEHIGSNRQLVTGERIVSGQGAAPLPAALPQSSDLLETLRKFWRNRGLIAASIAVFGGISLAVAVLLPTRYAAEARVQIGVPEAKALDVEAIMQTLGQDDERAQSETFVMQSRQLAEQVVDRLDLLHNPEFNAALRPPTLIGKLTKQIEAPFAYLTALLPGTDDAVESAKKGESTKDKVIDVVLSRVDVSALGRSHVLSIVAQSESPDLAAALANGLAEAYLQEERDYKITLTDSAGKYLDRRIAELREQVDASERKVEDYRRRNGLYQATNAGVTTQQLTELNTQLMLAQTAKAEADARLREVRSPRAADDGYESAPAVLGSPLIQALKQQQAEAERHLAELSATYGDNHPNVVDARAQIGDAKRKIKLEVSRIIDGLKHEASTADARYEALRQNFDQLKSQMGNVNEKAIQLEALDREAQVNRTLLETVLNRSKELMGQQQLAQPDARLVSRAAAPDKSSMPPKSLIVLLGAVGGGLLGMLLAMMRDGLDRTFRRQDQVGSLTGLRVLSLIPNVPGRVSPPVHVLRKPVSAFSEALRKLHIGLQLSESDHSPKSVLFSSAVPGEGKSIVAASLARMLASNGRRILLIDCDWRRPTLHRLFNRSNSGGLAMLLSENDISLDQIIYNDALSGADVIFAGALEPQLGHLMTSERMRLLVQTLTKSYDMVILDAPPVLVGAEVLTLARVVEKVVYTVRWGSTAQSVALEGLKQLLEAQADVAGVALTRVDPKRYRRYAYSHLDYSYIRPALAYAR
jgi:capsular exopolysaccharide synthesis family protein